MPNHSSNPSHRHTPRDPNALASYIVRLATESREKDPLAVELGRRGGLKGGKARAAKLSAKKRREIAKRAAQARWSVKDGQQS